MTYSAINTSLAGSISCAVFEKIDCCRLPNKIAEGWIYGANTGSEDNEAVHKRCHRFRKSIGTQKGVSVLLPSIVHGSFRYQDLASAHIGRQAWIEVPQQAWWSISKYNHQPLLKRANPAGALGKSFALEARALFQTLPTPLLGTNFKVIRAFLPKAFL